MSNFSLNIHIRTLFLAAGALTIALLGSGCDHDTDLFDGPSLVDRFGEFELLEPLGIDRATVDFSAGESVTFTARFNKRIDWVLVITGTESGAVKRIEGFENELSADNARWLGGTTELPLFKNELCMVELIIPEEDSLTMTGEVTIVGAKIYDGAVYADFETDAGSNIFVGNFEFELTPASGRTNSIAAGQGDYCWFFQGTDNVVSNFFVGLIDIQAAVTGETYAPVPTTVPEDLYFNCMVYSDGGLYGLAVLQLIYDSNDSGAFEDGQDQVFALPDIALDFEGWRLFSFQVGELGLSEQQLSKIVNIRALLISQMNLQPNPPLQVDYALDYLIFTAGGPLEL